MKIKKAVFPVAGFGTRFLPATKSTPKEMLPVVDKPLIQYAVEEACKIGVEEFIFITHHAKGSIDKHFQENKELHEMLIYQGKNDLADSIKDIGGPNAKFVSVDQGEPKGLGHAIGCAENYISDDEFFGNNLNPLISNDGLIRAQNTYKRNKELSILITLGIYILNIIDANVDAHLKQYNLNENLSIKPQIEFDEIHSNSSFSLCLNFNL